MIVEARIYIEQIDTMSATLSDASAGLPRGDLLHALPGPGLNSIGWNYWHLLRIWDYDLNWSIRGSHPHDDLWHRQRFTARSGYNPDGKGTDGNGLGSRYRDFEVDELNIPFNVLNEYHDALLAETRVYLDEAGERRVTPHRRPAVRPEQSTGSRQPHPPHHRSGLDASRRATLCAGSAACESRKRTP